MQQQQETNQSQSLRELLGNFRVPISLENSKFRLFKQKLLPFWTEDRIRSIFLPIVNDCNPVSLRMLDWLCTNFAKRRSVVCVRKYPQNNNVEFVDICQRYKQECAEHRRAGFDPFARAHGKNADDWILLCDIDGQTFRTTVAQLNFLQWAEENEVLRYAKDHRSEIAAEMRENQAERRRNLIYMSKRKSNPIELSIEPQTARKKRKQITSHTSPPCRAFPLNNVQQNVYEWKIEI